MHICLWRSKVNVDIFFSYPQPSFLGQGLVSLNLDSISRQCWLAREPQRSLGCHCTQPYYGCQGSTLRRANACASKSLPTELSPQSLWLTLKHGENTRQSYLSGKDFFLHHGFREKCCFGKSVSVLSSSHGNIPKRIITEFLQPMFFFQNFSPRYHAI